MKSTLMRITFIFLAALFLFMSSPSYSIAEKRVALLIGNSNYDVGRLRNPVTDATDMAAALKKLGFSVIIQNDADHKEMETAIKEFGRQLKKDTVGLFFYAGHGVQIDGRNYLIPLGANIEEEGDVKYKAVNINRVFDVMDNAGNRLNIVILDACRDNPYAKSFRSSSRGLAIVGKSPNDTLIAYSTSPGQVASDGSGRNSPYTRALLDNINRPGLSIEQVFKKVRNDLDNTTSGRQKPWYLASLGTDFYFNPGKIKKSDEVNQLTTAEEEISPADELANENKKLEAERRRLDEEKAAFTKQKALEEKQRKIEEESERIAAQKDAARQAEADRKKQALEEKRRQIAEEKERLAAEKEAARQAELERKQAKKTLAMAKRPSVPSNSDIEESECQQKSLHTEYFKQAEELLDKKAYSESLDYYKRAIESAKKCNIDYKTLARYYSRMQHPYRLMENMVSAEQCIKKSIELDPYNSGGYIDLAFLPSKNLSQKIVILEKGYKIAGSKDSTLLVNLGGYYLASGKRNLAMKAFEDSYRISPTLWDGTTPSKWFEYYDKQKDDLRAKIEKESKKYR